MKNHLIILSCSLNEDNFSEQQANKVLDHKKKVNHNKAIAYIKKEGLWKENEVAGCVVFSSSFY